MGQIFLSYAHTDHSRLLKGLVHLEPAFEELYLKAWWDKDLKAGQRWHPAIEERIREADIFICFLTAGWVASEYIRDYELPAIRDAYFKRQSLVLPIYVEDCNWKARFKGFRQPQDLSDTPLQAMPVKAGTLRAVVKFATMNEGFNLVREQVDRAITEFIPSKPTLRETTIAKMVPTEEGFRFVAQILEAASSLNPVQQSALARIAELLASLEAHSRALDNAAPGLKKAIAGYRQVFADGAGTATLFDLWSRGRELADWVEATPAKDLKEALSHNDSRDVQITLSSLVASHYALLMSTPEGLKLVAQADAARTETRTEVRRVTDLLTSLLQNDRLYDDKTAKFGQYILDKLSAPGVDKLSVAEALLFVVSSLIGFGQVLEDVADKAIATGEPVDRGDLSDLQAVTETAITRAETPIVRFSQKREELRRYVPWLVTGLKARRITVKRRRVRKTEAAAAEKVDIVEEVVAEPVADPVIEPAAMPQVSPEPVEAAEEKIAFKPPGIDFPELQSPMRAAYKRLIKSGELTVDPAQQAAFEQLFRLERQVRESQSMLRAAFGLRPRVYGLYLWGPPGRGKSMMMDLFFNHAQIGSKRRVRFPVFMAEVHHLIRKWRESDGKARRQIFGISTGDDPIAPVARLIAKQSQLLCFDELQVTDIADAMILGRLFEALFAHRVVMVATSNHAPDDLYKNGLNRDLFQPFIDMIKVRCTVCEIAGPRDFRMDRLRGAKTYFFPSTAPESVEGFNTVWDRMTKGMTELEAVLTVNERKLIFRRAVGPILRSTFAELCGEANGPADYLEIAEHFTTVFIENVPIMGPSNRNTARRFVTLIDALYESSVKVVILAETEPAKLYAAGDGAFEFERTVARLEEMCSEDYLWRT